MKLVTGDVSRVGHREYDLAQYNLSKTNLKFEPLASAIRLASYAELLKSPHQDKVLSAEGDVGNVVCASDIKIDEALKEIATKIGFPSFSEEREGSLVSVDGKHVPERLTVSKLIEFDPVDGTGDRLKGESGTNAAKGFSTLAAVFQDYRLVAGICIRPAHNQQFIFSQNEGILQYEIDPMTLDAKRVEFKRKEGNPNIRRVNLRLAYPETNYPESVLARAEEITGYRFDFVETGGAGDALSRLILGELDIVISGMKRNWKTWDTDPFILALTQIPRGEITDYNGDLLERSPLFDEDLVHREGVCASVGSGKAARELLQVISEYEKSARMEFHI